MRLFNILYAVGAGITAFAAENPIIFPGTGAEVKAGSTVTITWKPTTEGDISLVLRYGQTRDLTNGGDVTSQPNTGSYEWRVPSTIGNGVWSIEIKDASGKGESNYSPMFQVSGGTGKQGEVGSTSKAPSSTTASPTSTKGTTSTTATSASTSKSSSAKPSTSSSSKSASSTSSAKSSAPSSGANSLQGGPLAAMLGVGAMIAMA